MMVACIGYLLTAAAISSNLLASLEIHFGFILLSTFVKHFAPFCWQSLLAINRDSCIHFAGDLLATLVIHFADDLLATLAIHFAPFCWRFVSDSCYTFVTIMLSTLAFNFVTILLAIC
jgi:hypothetical protein